MRSQMLAAVYHAPCDIRTELVDRPEPAPQDVLLRVTRVGICGSDLHMLRAGVYGARPGMIMGHEFCGVAVEVGADVPGVIVDGRYTGFTISYCGHCYWCLRGQQRLCPSLFDGYTGFGKPGAMAEYILIEKAVLGENLIEIPQDLTDEQAALAEPLGTAVYAVRRAKIAPGDTVVVIGAGPIGNLVIQACKTISDVRVIATELSASRGQRALQSGADVVLDAHRPDLLDAVAQETGPGRFAFGTGAMADVVIDAAGAPQSFAQALSFVRSKGTVGLVGLGDAPTPIDTSLIIHKDVRVVGVFGSSIPDGVELLRSGTVDVGPLVTTVYPIERAQEAFVSAADRDSMKVMLTVDAQGSTVT